MRSVLLIVILVVSGSPLLANPYGDYQRSGRAASLLISQYLCIIGCFG